MNPKDKEQKFIVLNFTTYSFERETGLLAVNPSKFAHSSEKRDSNPRPRPWQGRALPTELFSQCMISTTLYRFKEFN